LTYWVKGIKLCKKRFTGVYNSTPDKLSFFTINDGMKYATTKKARLSYWRLLVSFFFLFSIRLGLDFGTQIVGLKFGGGTSFSSSSSSFGQ
jgi:hypothetical protein